MSKSSNKLSGCNAVNEHISKHIPDILWHYTSYIGFQGIVTSKRIWATEYRFLNDREELLHAKELARKLVDEEPEFVGERFPAREQIRTAVDVAFSSGLHEDRLHVMVASFTEEGDQLSQWRGYADNSRGVSVGLDLCNLRPSLDVGTAVTFAPCIYQQVEKVALLKEIFAHFRNGLQEWWNSIIARAREFQGKVNDPEFGQKLVAEHQRELRDVMNRSLAALQFDLLRTAPLLKNESFSEEKEWRLVLPWNPIKLPMQHPLEFRPIRDTLVPYVAYPLNRPNQQGPVFCKGVILGPGSHASAEVGIKLFLRKCEIPLSPKLSRIPYRPS